MTDRKCFVFRFADVEVREREFLLVKAGEQLALEPKAFRVLLFLLQNPGRLVSKDEIVASVWSDSAVSDNSLTRSIAQLRRVLGDDSRQPLYILTVPTVGYRFLCEVTATDDGFGAGARAESNGKLNGGPPDKSRPDQSRPDQSRPDQSRPDQSRLDQSRPDPPPVPHIPGPGTWDKSSLPKLLHPSDARAKESVPSRTMLIAGLVATLVVFAAGAMIWRAFGTKAVSSRDITYPLVERRLTSNPPEDPIRGALISPDGKYLVYKDATGLYLREISTGETHPWSLPEGFLARPTSWFPDSVHLLVERVEGQPQRPDLQKVSLYKLSLLGGDPQKIIDNAAGGSVSPDGTRIAYLPGPAMKFGRELWVMNVDGTNPRELAWAGILDSTRALENWIMPPVWSPESQRLAYIEGHEGVGSKPNGQTASLMTVNANGSGLNEVWNDSRIGGALNWASDGRILVAYHQDQAQGSSGVSSFRLDDRTGKALGGPRPITQAEGGLASLNSTADGKRLVLWRTKAPTEVFVAKFDPRARQFDEPRRLTLDENENYATAWTADSKSVLFTSNRQGIPRLFKQAIDETTPETLVEANRIAFPRLSPDGSEALYLTSSNGSTSRSVSLMAKPLAGGPPRLVAEEGIINYGCAQAPSDQCVFSKPSAEGQTFVAFNVKQGAGREIATLKEVRNWVISPDGSKLAIVIGRNRIRFLSMKTGAARDVTVKDWPLSGTDWSANSRSLFITSVTSNGSPVVLEVDQAGKAKVVLEGSANTAFVAMIQSPDGQYGLLLERIPAESNVWMVDNF